MEQQSESCIESGLCTTKWDVSPLFMCNDSSYFRVPVGSVGSGGVCPIIRLGDTPASTNCIFWCLQSNNIAQVGEFRISVLPAARLRNLITWYNARQNFVHVGSYRMLYSDYLYLFLGGPPAPNIVRLKAPYPVSGCSNRGSVRMAEFSSGEIEHQ